MILSRLFAIALLFSVCIHNSVAQKSSQKLVISQLTGDFYIYTSFQDYSGKPYPSNSMYMVTTNGVILFDTPWDSTQFQPLLDSIFNRHRKKVVLVISTHFHSDRTAGLEYYKSKGIKTYSSKHTRELCKQFNEKQAEFVFTNDTVFNIGNHKFETFYPGGGHTKDNIVVWFNNEKILYGGCLIKSTEAETLGNMSDAYPDEWVATMEKLIKKYPNPKFVIPGHQSWDSVKSLQHTLKLAKQYNSLKK